MKRWQLILLSFLTAGIIGSIIGLYIPETPGWVMVGVGLFISLIFYRKRL
jgi:hypothetical protein